MRRSQHVAPGGKNAAPRQAERSRDHGAFRLFPSPPHPDDVLGGLLLSLSGCVAVPLGQLAYQAATATAKPCATVGDSGGCGPSGLSSIWDGLKAGVAGR